MWEHMRYMGPDVLTHTHAGVPYINSEALSQIVLYLAERAGGLEGVRILWIALSLLSLGLVLGSARAAGARGGALFALAAAALWLLGPRLKPRPEVFSWVFFGAVSFAVEAARRGNPVWEKRLPWIVGGVFLLWVNTHLGFVYGLLYLAAALVGARAAGDRPSFIARLDRSFTAALVCFPLSPAGFGLLRVLLEFGFDVHHGVPIGEARPTTIGDAPLFWAALLLAGAALARGILRRDPEDRRWVLAVIGFGAIGAGIVRSSVLIVFPLMPYLGGKIAAWERRNPGASRLAGRIAGVLSVGGLVAFAAFRSPPNGLLSRHLPVGACRFVKEAGIEGTMYNSYGWGGFIEWALPGRKVFQDGRYLSVPFLWEEADLSLHWPDSDRRGLWAAYLGRYGVDYGIADDLPAPAPESLHPPLMSERLFSEDRWALVYWDDLSWVFVKRIPKFEPLIRAREYRALRPARQELLFAGTLPAPPAAIRAELERHAREVPFSRKGAFLEDALRVRSGRS
jgi:hypothetical protein